MITTSRHQKLLLIKLLKTTSIHVKLTLPEKASRLLAHSLMDVVLVVLSRADMIVALLHLCEASEVHDLGGFMDYNRQPFYSSIHIVE